MIDGQHTKTPFGIISNSTTSQNIEVVSDKRATVYSNFTYDRKSFYLNGVATKIIGGQMDPQRVPRAYWADRLQKAKAMGLNTIFSYTYWNIFEPKQGQWNFTGDNDMAAWYQAIKDAGLYAVLRPGPYVCGERDWGGFPAWLATVPNMKVRANNAAFLDAAGKYIKRLAQEIQPAMITRGGPILMVQVENEYGNYGVGDHTYTAALANFLRASFDKTVLYTNDAGNEGALKGGQVPGVLALIDGDPRTGFTARDKFITDTSSLGPQLDGEFYVKWFDYWGTKSSHQSYANDAAGANKIISDMEWILSANNSVSIYMWHGGTNWGYGNGAVNFGNGLQPFTTSYDYGAPLDEAGRPTAMYNSMRTAIQKFVPAGSIPAIPSSPPLMDVADFTLTPIQSLWKSLPAATVASAPTHMEALGQQFGYVLYETNVNVTAGGKLSPGDYPRDRVIVYVNGAKVGVTDSVYKSPQTVNLNLKSGDLLQLLVENLGRVDYGGAIADQRKGIVGDVKVGSKVLRNWRMYSLPLDSPPAAVTAADAAPVAPKQNGEPHWYKGGFKTNNTGLAADTFLNLPGGVKGVVWVNGVNLGRYWVIGPQQELFVPGCFLRAGETNEVVVLELEPSTEARTAKGTKTRTWANKADPDCPGC